MLPSTVPCPHTATPTLRGVTSGTAAGTAAIALGQNSSANGEGSVAVGLGSSTTGDNAIALGNGVTAGANEVVIGNVDNTYQLPGDAGGINTQFFTGTDRFLITDYEVFPLAPLP